MLLVSFGGCIVVGWKFAVGVGVHVSHAMMVWVQFCRHVGATQHVPGGSIDGVGGMSQQIDASALCSAWAGYTDVGVYGVAC